MASGNHNNNYQPRTDEDIGTYSKRLREATGLSLAKIAERSSHLPGSFTRQWLYELEAGKYEHPGGDKLQTLAEIYSQLLESSIPLDWFLAKTAASLPLDQTTRLFSRQDILTLVGIAGQLIKSGYEEDVKLLITLAQRYLQARDPEAHPGDIFDDPELSAHVESYMKKLGI
jgi:transcriptional regulator with XRE-family HTH domain